MSADKKTMIKNALKIHVPVFVFSLGLFKDMNLTEFSDHDVLGEILDFGSISAHILKKSRK